MVNWLIAVKIPRETVREVGRELNASLRCGCKQKAFQMR